MRQAVIVSGARTPVGKFGGVFRDVCASDLAACVIKAALERAHVLPEDVDELIFGNAIQATESGYMARRASLRAGIPQEVPAISVNRQCSSGLEAINMAAQLIRAGEVDCVIAGGAENMSQSPYMLDYQVRFDGLRLGDGNLRDGLTDVLSCPMNRYHMGVTAENIAERFNISREEQDELALMSQQRAVSAAKAGRFDNQIEEVVVARERGSSIRVEVDEEPRENSTIDKLKQLQPVFMKNGTVTAGNSSGISDGAAAVVIMSEEKAENLGLAIRLKWHARAVVGVDPAFMGAGPVSAIRKVLARSGTELANIDLIELNEAFAAQALYCIQELDLNMDITNVNGSGISLGHPIGATGAIMTVKLMEELELRDQEMGMVSMCVGGGQGVATIFQRVT